MTSSASALLHRVPPTTHPKPGAEAGSGEVRGRRSVPARIASAFGTLLLIVGVVALLFMTVAPRVFHYRTATMLTGSMAPGIKPGDIIVDTPEPAADIAVGQIISYHIPVDDHRVESHRVVWVRHAEDGSVAFRTQGDANSTPDPWTARVDSTQVWRVRAVVPVLGSVIRALRLPIVHLLLAVGLPAALVIWLLIGIWRPRPQDDEDAAQSPHPAGAAAAQEPGPSR